MNKKISAPIAIGIILILSVALGSFTILQLSEMRKERKEFKFNINISEKKTDTECQKYGEDNCPTGCMVCPPCEVCSSISCNSAQLCKKMGFDKSWYENIKLQQETADWQTYRNGELSIELKYPNHIFDVIEKKYLDSKNNEKIQLLFDPKINEREIFPCGVTIGLANGTIEEIRTLVETTELDKEVSFKDISIGNYEGLEVITLSSMDGSPDGSGAPGPVRFLYLSHNSQTYVVFVCESIPETEKVFYQILSTFKFID
jgi:hypothetical protein